MGNRIFSVGLILLFCCGVKAEASTKVTFLVVYDLTSSMDEHYAKMEALVPIVDQAMKQSRCEYQVGVATAFYQDVSFNNLTPMGNPIFITEKHGLAGIEEIRRRLTEPFTVLTESHGLQFTKSLLEATKEETYTSLVKSVRHNLASLQDQHVVGTLLLTDAAPGLDPMAPKAALQEIKSMLNKTLYMPAVVRFPFKNGMTHVHPQAACQPDYPFSEGYAVFGQGDPFVRTAHWPNPDIEALDKFIDAAYGSKWDLCEKDYDAKLREYVDEVLTAAGCNLMM